MATVIKCEAGSAVFSACGCYRYLLTRQLDPTDKFNQAVPVRPLVTFIMLNPSTADATHNDPTIRKCIGFARRWQCATLQVLNLFALRATLPRVMKQAADPVGAENLAWFARALTPPSHATHLIICAWGVHGAHRGQDRAVLEWLDARDITTHALALTRQGQPRHPLYLPYSAQLIPYGRDHALYKNQQSA